VSTDSVTACEIETTYVPELQSVDSMSEEPRKTSEPTATEDGPFIPPPLVPRSVILAFGFGIFVLALIWPPLILLVTYFVSVLVPYSFRKNDDPTSRRRMYQEFCSRTDVPACCKFPEKDVVSEKNYWVNARYVRMHVDFLFSNV
jgi:hypothetical protein